MSKILIAEDNAVNRELLRELLEMRGHIVAEACDGEEALLMIEQTQPDLLLLDIGMPLLDGFGVMRKIRESPQFASLPVVAVTTDSMHGRHEKSFRLQVYTYLFKPLNTPALVVEPCPPPC